MDKHCEKCGALLAENEKVCHKCGTPVRRSSVEETAASAHSTDLQKSGEKDGRGIRKPFAENTASATNKNKGSDKIVMFISAAILVIAVVLALILKTGVLSKNNSSEPEPPEQKVDVTDGDDEKPDDKSDETDDIHPSAESATDQEEPADTEASEEGTAANDEPVTEPADENIDYNTVEDKPVIDEEYVAEGWYTYYMSYLDAINHGGDISYLKHATDERKKSFKTNYEKYNKGFTFENLSFDVDKTDMKIKDIGNGKLEATCHAYVVNVCTEIATGIIEDNRVTLLGKLEIDSATGDYLLTLQQSDKEYSFGKHEMIHCAE